MTDIASHSSATDTILKKFGQVLHYYNLVSIEKNIKILLIYFLHF